MGFSIHGRHAKSPGSERVPLVILDLGVFVGTFLFRWLTVAFPNDHFLHLSKARQILLGDVPIRDFFDAGFFLQNYLSSAAQLLFGYNLFGEALLTIAFVAFGTALVFDLSARLSGSRWVATGATLLTVLAFPRLYSYPKVFLYVSAISLAWLYTRRGGQVRVVLMAALTAVAFLLRHDHGVYIGVMLVCFLGLHEWGGARFWRRLGLYAGVTVGLLLPFMVFVQTTTGMASYVGGSGPQAQTIAASLLSLLSAPVAFEIDWSALGPGVFNRQNALAWFYYLTILLPVVALGRVCADWWSGRTGRPEAAIVVASAILCIIISHTLIRDNPGARTADVAAPTFVLAAWLAGRRSDPGKSLFRARLKRTTIVSLLLVTCWSVWTVSGSDVPGGFGSLLARTGVPDGPTGVWAQFGAVNRQLRRRPIDEWAPPGSTGLQALTRYVHDCTAPSDRVLVTWFEPGMFYYAERGFAGGRSFLHTGDGGWHTSSAAQRLTLDRMQRQSVPIILGRRNEEEEFRQGFPIVYDYVRTRYRLASESTFGERSPGFLVFVDTRLEPDAEHPYFGLPCYREPGDDFYGLDNSPVIHVRWIENLGDAERTVLERSLGLYRAEHRAGSTWRYRVPNVSTDRYAAMAAHEMVDDTYGFDQAADARFGPAIHVRWAETLGNARRTALARSLGLYRAEHSEGSTWRYQVPDASRQRLRAIVAHDAVVDTSGFDRGTLELDEPAGEVPRFTGQLVYAGGWYPVESDAAVPESTWQWTQQAATLSFANPNADAAFYLDYAARPDLFTDGPQTVTVSIGDQVLQSFAADVAGRRLRRIPLTTAALGTEDMVEIQIAVDRTFVPANLPAGGRDDRDLGIQVHQVFVVLR